MAAVAAVARQPLPQQSVTTSSKFEAIVKKVSEIVLSRWALVVVTAVLSGACFGVLIGLTAASMAALIALSAPNKAAEAVKNGVEGTPATPALLEKRVDSVVNFSGGVIQEPAGVAKGAPKRIFPPIPPVPGIRGSQGHNVQIFRQTLALIAEGERIDPEQHRQTVQRARVVPEILQRAVVQGPRVATQLIVEPVTTYEMTRRLVQQGYRPLVLDMANLYIPGGSVTTGARAQEETVCRQSTLYPALQRLPYPLPECGGAFVPGVQFFRDDAYQGVEPLTADVFASAAYNCNRAHGDGYDRPEADEVYSSGTERKIRTMLRLAIENGNRALVLSAFGCGAFRNDPRFIADTYRRILNEPEFRGAFDVVSFGIYDPPSVRDPNCPIFRQVLAGA
jgi:uncharacterized protein (TIGR02452 family)